MKVNHHATKANWNEYRAPMDGHGTSCKQSVSTMEVDRRELLVYLSFEKLWQSGMAAKVKAENRPAMKWLNVKWQWTIISWNGKPRWARWTELQRTDTIVAFKKSNRGVLLMLTMFVAWAQIAKHNDIAINKMRETNAQEIAPIFPIKSGFCKMSFINSAVTKTSGHRTLRSDPAVQHP